MKELLSNIMEIVSNNNTWFSFEGKKWMPLTTVGQILAHDGINFREYGYEKLVHVFDASSEKFVLYWDTTCNPSVVYVRLKEDAKKTTTKNKNYLPLEDWAYLGNLSDTLDQLAVLNRDGDIWSFNNGRPKSPRNPILYSFLRYTFCRLQYQNKIGYSVDQRYAAFNTGLFDCHYDAIIALFERNKKPFAKSQWVFRKFVKEGTGDGKIIINYFPEALQPATYTENPSDLIYDYRLGEPLLDMDHILLKHPERLPMKFVEKHMPADFTVQDPSELDKSGLNAYSFRLCDVIRNSEEIYRNMAADFNQAIKFAMKRVRWNFNTAVPMFYPRDNQVCLLLPLCLVNDEKEDIALVVKKTIANRYSGATILTLDMAYADARLIRKPNSEWLDASKISGLSERVL